MTNELTTLSSTKPISKSNQIPRITFIVLANLILRIANLATSALIGFYFASLANDGQYANAALLGAIAAMVPVFEMFGAMPFGYLSDKYSPRVIMIFGAILGGVATLIFSWGGGLIVVFFVSRAIEGLGSAAISPSLLSSLTEMTKGNERLRAIVMGFFEISLLAGFALGGLVGGITWDSFGTIGFAIVASFYIFVAFLSSAGSQTVNIDPDVDRPGLIDNLRKIFRDSQISSLAPAWLALNAIGGMWITHTTFLLTGPIREGQYLTGQFTPSRTGQFLAIYAAVFAVGVILWSLVISIGRYNLIKILKVTIGSIVIVSLFFYLINISASWSDQVRSILVLLLALSIMFESGFTPAALNLLAEITDQSDRRGSVMGVYSMLLGLGYSIGIFGGGLLAQFWAVNGLIVASVILSIVAYYTLSKISMKQKEN